MSHDMEVKGLEIREPHKEYFHLFMVTETQRHLPDEKNLHVLFH